MRGDGSMMGVSVIGGVPAKNPHPSIATRWQPSPASGRGFSRALSDYPSHAGLITPLTLGEQVPARRTAPGVAYRSPLRSATVTRSTTVEVPQTATSPRWHPRGAGRSLRRLSGRMDTPANPVVAVLGPSAARLAWLSAHAKAGCGATLCRTSRRTGWDGWRHEAAEGFVPVTALDGRPKPLERDAEFFRK